MAGAPPNQQNNFLLCFLCGAKLEQRTDKHHKPYFICNPCGIQLFVRRQHGIELLAKLMHSSRWNQRPVGECTDVLSTTQALLAEVNTSEAQLDVLKRKLQHWLTDLEQLAQAK
jgi:hypothetical protein